MTPIAFPLPADPALADAVRQALAGLPAGAPVAVAVSGGADSAMLAVHVAHAVAAARERGGAGRSVAMQVQDVDAAMTGGQEGGSLRLFHVHHGLQEAADGWADQVSSLARLLDVPLDIVRVAVDTGAGLGVEAAAREARYAALADLARRHDAKAVLLAHHRHDQAETLLLRLLRGTGPSGMAGMARDMARGGVRYLRPWLDVDRGAILAAARRWAEATGWQVVADPTNEDARYGRGAVRTLLAPVLDARWPGWRDSLARHARQAAEAAAILDEVARRDFAGLEPSEDGRSFGLAAWRRLAPAHQTLVLRYWFDRHGARMPTEARLAELVRQLRQLHALGHDRQLLVGHGAVQVRCVRGRVILEPRARRAR